MKMSSASYLVLLVILLNQNLPVSLQAVRDAVARFPKQCPANSKLKFSYSPLAGDGPEKWISMSQCCSGEWQSPININTTECSCNMNHRIRYSLFPLGSVQGVLYNGGYAVTSDFSRSETPSLLGVPYYKDEYAFGNLHFHAGNFSGHGSEHYIDNQGYDGELHLVHYKKSYGSIKEALKYNDGLAVVGIFLKENTVAPNTEMENLITSTRQVLEIGTKLLFSVDIRRLFPWGRDFYVYHGSLTTPPCSESVRWIVMKDPVLISSQSHWQRGSLALNLKPKHIFAARANMKDPHTYVWWHSYVTWIRSLSAIICPLLYAQHSPDRKDGGRKFTWRERKL